MLGGDREVALIVVSAAGSVDITNYNGSVSASSFIQAYETLTGNGFHVEVATPDGSPAEFHFASDKERDWISKHPQLSSRPKAVASIAHGEEESCVALVFPSSLGGVSDLAADVNVARLVRQFADKRKPLCAVGYGVTGLCKAFSDEDQWCFDGFSLTAISNFEVARQPLFAKLPFVLEDYVNENGGIYSAAAVDSLHVVVDRFLVTGQNDVSTTLAVQNLVWLVRSGR